MCCEGEEIKLQDIRAPEQKKIMEAILPILQAGLKTGATPFPGALSAPPDIGQTAAMKTMMGLGGYGGYDPYPMPRYPLPPGTTPPTDDDEETYWEKWRPPKRPGGGEVPYEYTDWWKFDPYAPQPERRRTK